MHDIYAMYAIISYAMYSSNPNYTLEIRYIILLYYNALQIRYIIRYIIMHYKYAIIYYNYVPYYPIIYCKLL